MNRNILLVANSDNGLTDLVKEAAEKTDRGLRKANSCRPTFEIFNVGLDDVDAIILEIDASLHSIAILEALNYREAAPPAIALIGVDEVEAMHIVHRHGATACLKKPFNADELAALIDNVSASARQKRSPSCDKWGHVRSGVFAEVT